MKEKKLSLKQKKMLIRIIIAAVLLIALNFIPVKGILRMILFLIPYLVIGYDILKKAGKGILNRQVFDENFLMAVATIGAIAIAIYDRSGNFNEAVAVMLFYQIGELFQSYAVNRSRQSISAMMDICPEYANIEQNGVLTQVDPDDVEVGDIIVIKPGERIPLDGVVEEGSSSVDTAALVAGLVTAFEASSILDVVFHGLLLWYLAMGVRRGREAMEEPEGQRETPEPLPQNTEFYDASMGERPNSPSMGQPAEGKHRTLLTAAYGSHEIEVRRSYGLTELIVDGRVYGRQEGVVETGYTIRARVSGHDVETEFTPTGKQLLRVDGQVIARKQRLF